MEPGNQKSNKEQAKADVVRSQGLIPGQRRIGQVENGQGRSRGINSKNNAGKVSLNARCENESPVWQIVLIDR